MTDPNPGGPKTYGSTTLICYLYILFCCIFVRNHGFCANLELPQLFWDRSRDVGSRDRKDIALSKVGSR
jgi:hypothetical protein